MTKRDIEHEEYMKIEYGMTAEDLYEREGVEEDDVVEYLEMLTTDSVCPALCKNGCEVEPDGRCPHGQPSLLIELGLV